MPATYINTTPTGPKRGRPRARHAIGTLTSGGGGYFFTDEATGGKVEIKENMYKALSALGKNPDRAYEEVAQEAGFEPDTQGKFSPPLSRAIKSLLTRCATAAAKAQAA